MMITLPKILVLTVALLVFSGFCYAGEAGRESQFSIGSGVRALGIGGGFVGLSDDASAVYWNQATLGLLEKQEVSLMHSTLFEGSVYDVAEYVYPTANSGGFGFSFMRLGTGDIIKRTNWFDDGDFSYSISQFIMAYGRRIEGGFYIGGAMKFVNQSLDKNSTSGFGLDLSFYGPLNKNVAVGVLFQDIIPPRLKLSGNSETTPYNIMVGLGIKDIRLFKEFSHKVNLAVEIPEDRSVKIHAGFESTWRNRIDLRAGYDRSNFVFGIGLYHKRIKFDYAYKIMDGITDSHRFGFTFTIGSSVSEKLRRDFELQNARGSYLIMDDRQKQFEYYREVGNNFYRNNNLDSAFAYYQRALAFRQDDSEIIERIENIGMIRLEAMEKYKSESSERESRQTLLNGYYAQAEDFYNQELLISSLGVIKTALQIEADEARFMALREKVNRSIENKIVELLDKAREAEKQGRLTDAVTAYNNILTYSPGDATVKRLVSRIGTAIDIARLISQGVEYFYAGNYPRAERDFQNVLNIASDNSVAIEYLSRIVSIRQQRIEQKNLEDDEATWRIYLTGMEHYRNGEYNKAIEFWDEVLKLYPGNEQTLENIKQARLRLQSEQ